MMPKTCWQLLRRWLWSTWAWSNDSKGFHFQNLLGEIYFKRRQATTLFFGATLAPQALSRALRWNTEGSSKWNGTSTCLTCSVSIIWIQHTAIATFTSISWQEMNVESFLSGYVTSSTFLSQLRFCALRLGSLGVAEIHVGRTWRAWVGTYRIHTVPGHLWLSWQEWHIASMTNSTQLVDFWPSVHISRNADS